MKKVLVFLSVLVLVVSCSITAMAADTRAKVFPSWSEMYDVTVELPERYVHKGYTHELDSYIIYFSKSEGSEGNNNMNVVMWDSTLAKNVHFSYDNGTTMSFIEADNSVNGAYAFHCFTYSGGEWKHFKSAPSQVSYYKQDELYANVDLVQPNGELYQSSGVSAKYGQYLEDNDEDYQAEYLDRLIVYFNSKTLWEKVLATVGVLVAVGVAILASIGGVVLIKRVISRFVEV